MRKTTARVQANPQEVAANREAFRRLSNAYAARDVYGIREIENQGRTAASDEIENLGRTAVPNALSGTFVGNEDNNTPDNNPAKSRLAVVSGVDFKIVQDRHRFEVLPTLGIELV